MSDMSMREENLNELLDQADDYIKQLSSLYELKADFNRDYIDWALNFKQCVLKKYYYYLTDPKFYECDPEMMEEINDDQSN